MIQFYSLRPLLHIFFTNKICVLIYDYLFFLIQLKCNFLKLSPYLLFTLFDQFEIYLYCNFIMYQLRVYIRKISLIIFFSFLFKFKWKSTNNAELEHLLI